MKYVNTHNEFDSCKLVTPIQYRQCANNKQIIYYTYNTQAIYQKKYICKVGSDKALMSDKYVI